jgi:TrmH family RNA methyltransferase
LAVVSIRYKEITSAANTRVKTWASLLDKKGREREQRALVEGTHLVEEALRFHVLAETLIFDLERGIPQEVEAVLPEHLECIGVTPAILAKLTDTPSPQSVVLVIEKANHAARKMDFLYQEKALVVAIDGVQDPGNLGTIIRAADAAGATAVLVGKGSVDVYNPKVMRATMGSLFHLPVLEVDLVQTLQQAQSNVQIIGTSLQATTSCYGADLTKPSWFVFGNEGQGISEAIQPYLNTKVIIPMPGQAESLNVAMAATILLFEAVRQRTN